VLVAPIPNDARAVVIAIPLGDVDDTLQRLVFVELGVSGIALLVILGGTLLLVRLSLRPLDRFATTADEIAAGDLSRRVSPADRRTEVGRLGVALNRMLARIEEAFRQKTESEQRLRRFVADASHELRTPLTSIRGFAELVSDRTGLSPADATNAARRIEQQSDRMARLVDDLLLLARLDEGQELSFEECEFGDVVQAAVDEARAADRFRTITAEIGPVTVRGDTLRLHQAVANLLANARQHTPPGTHIDVKLRADGRAAKLVIEDNGPGLSESDLPCLFDRFYRVDRSRSRQNGGSGLGLAIVKSIIEGHGGTVEAQRGLRAGARFAIRLPVAESDPGMVRHASTAC
jgi:two-component system OmpR family sensor kinase